jgi:hypothetical protein
MGREYVANLLPGASIRFGTAFYTPFNPEGDWGNAYMLAHPRASTELVCDFHAKRRRRTPDRFINDYIVTIRNAGSVVTPVDVDW